MMVQIRRILCPIDFSDTSRRALDHALALGRWYGAGVSVLHVHQLSSPVYAAPYMGPEAQRPILLTDGERQEMLTTLESYVAADRATSGISIDISLDESTDVSEAILSHAVSTRADLMTLGTHGRTGFRRLVMGSVTEKVIRQAGCPVLTVPPHAPDAVPRALVSIERILCAVDFSSSSIRALEYAASLSEQAKAKLTVLHVVELPPDLSEPGTPALVDYRLKCYEWARQQLLEAIRTFVPPGCDASELLLIGSAYREILRVSGELTADLIVIGVQGRGMIDRLFFGSTTNHVIRQATCPVLTLRGH
jgi:nucleotide-binding universal stress UspA family protein